MRKFFFAFTLAVSTLSLFGCAAGESAGSGKLVPIPSIRIDCTTTGCDNANSNIKVIAFITASGCGAPGFGAVRTTSRNITCATGVGCSGFLTSWIDPETNSTTTTIPDGTYSTCVIVDLDNNYAGEDAGTVGDAYGILDNMAVTDNTAPQFVTNFSDL